MVHQMKRRLRAMQGAPKAITAMPHRLACLIYRMLKFGEPCVDKKVPTFTRTMNSFLKSFLERSHNSLRVLGKRVVNFGWNLFNRHISLRIGSDEIEKIATKIE
jgi:hypothetical protein